MLSSFAAVTWFNGKLLQITVQNELLNYTSCWEQVKFITLRLLKFSETSMTWARSLKYWL